METEVVNPTSHGLDRRQERVSGVPMSNTFVLFTILLGGEVEVNANGCVEGSGSDDWSIEGDGAGDFKGCVTETEGVAKAATAGMLAGTEQVKIANDEEVADGRLSRVGGGQRVDGMAQKGEGDGLDSFGWRVVRLPGTLHLLEGLDDVASRI
jgi:hypothetical protein